MPVVDGLQVPLSAVAAETLTLSFPFAPVVKNKDAETERPSNESFNKGKGIRALRHGHDANNKGVQRDKERQGLVYRVGRKEGGE